MSTTELESFEERWAEFATLDRLVNHWWWRPGWHVGRSFYTWHLTFSGGASTALHDLVSRLQKELDGVVGLDPIPAQWLHLTMQGVGFADEVTEADLARIIDAARQRLASMDPFDLRLGPIEIDDEATALLVRPWEAVGQVRDAVRAAIGSVWATVPESAEFHPHVSIAYSSSDAPTAPIRERVAPLRTLDPVTVPVRSVQLIKLNRDNKMYVWDVVADIPLGS